jgi:hypothetical protein
MVQCARELWPEESAHSVTLDHAGGALAYGLWPEESAHSVTLARSGQALTSGLWPEESAHSVTLFSQQPPLRARVATFLGLKKHELHGGGLWRNARFSNKDFHLSELPVGDCDQPHLPLAREFRCD